jgi:hypothetical protein
MGPFIGSHTIITTILKKAKNFRTIIMLLNGFLTNAKKKLIRRKRNKNEKKIIKRNNLSKNLW